MKENLTIEQQIVDYLTYAKQYTDELFNSITFATNSDIDGLFSAKA